MNKVLFYISIIFLSFSCTNSKDTKTKSHKVSDKNENEITITPISHATAVIEFKNDIIYIDPTGGKKAFKNFSKPTFILITDIHGDHMNIKTLKELDLTETKVIAPKAVVEKLTNINSKEKIILNNSESKTFSNFSVEAIPMYNLREEALKFHPKGRGNGYVLTLNNKRIYFSGDTEDIKEMRSLKNIDKAFVCMNLPYTMTVESAAEAVLEFKPKEVYPYHYRGTNGLSDIEKFKSIVNNNNKTIKVVQLDWYKKND